MNAEDRMLEHADRLQAERDEWKCRALEEHAAVDALEVRVERTVGAARRVFLLLSELDLTVPMNVVGALIELRDALAAYDAASLEQAN